MVSGGITMNEVPQPNLTVAEYLAIENGAEFRSEYFNGEMFAMAGACPRHNRISMRLNTSVALQLCGSPCEPLGVDQRIKIQRKGLLTYPDLVIICGKFQLAPDDPMSIVNLTAIVEIKSPSTEGYDRGKKFQNYRFIPTLREYILIDQDEPLCESYFKQGDGTWAFAAAESLEETLEFRSVPVKVPLAELYAGLD